jgi:hypothetical protein
MQKRFTTISLHDDGFAGIFMLVIGLVFGAALVAGGYYGLQQEQKTKVAAINSFKDCAKLFPVMESYPAQCNTSDGKHFVQEVKEEEEEEEETPNIRDPKQNTPTPTVYITTESGAPGHPDSTGYVCPKTEYVDCMPMLTPEKQKVCSPDYLSWAQKNCPGFKGGAM